MKSNNTPSGAVRTANAGLVWEEFLTNASGTLEIDQYTTFRVRAAADLTVTINGRLAMSMASGEIEVFNTGDVDPSYSSRRTVTVVISAVCYLQVAREVEHRRQSPN